MFLALDVKGDSTNSPKFLVEAIGGGREVCVLIRLMRVGGVLLVGSVWRVGVVLGEGKVGDFLMVGVIEEVLL